MRMVFAQNLTHDSSALAVRCISPDAHIVHRIKYAAVHGFQPIPGIGQGSGYDHAHGVIEVRASHFLVDVYGADGTDFQVKPPTQWIDEYDPQLKTASVRYPLLQDQSQTALPKNKKKPSELSCKKRQERFLKYLLRFAKVKKTKNATKIGGGVTH